MAMNQGGNYATALEMDAENSWAGDASSRSASTQVMSAQSLGTYQRPLQVFKYKHLHEFMQGKGRHGAAPGTLGSGAGGRALDSKRYLHLPNTEEGPHLEDDEEGGGGGAASSKHRGDDPPVRERRQRHRAAPAPEAQGVGEEFLNKGLMVWEVVREQWRGSKDEVLRARERRRGLEHAPPEEVEEQFLDQEQPCFSRPVPLERMIAVLDELWEGDKTL